MSAAGMTAASIKRKGAILTDILGLDIFNSSTYFAKGIAMPEETDATSQACPTISISAAITREACIIEPENYLFYLELWQQFSKRYSVNGPCLLTDDNHIHILGIGKKIIHPSPFNLRS